MPVPTNRVAPQARVISAKLEAWRKLFDVLRQRHSPHDPVEAELELIAPQDARLLEYLGLNKDNPLHRGFCLAIFFELATLPKPKRGPPKGRRKWTMESLSLLGALAEGVEAYWPGTDDRKIAEFLKANPLKDDPRLVKLVGHVDTETIRKRLPEAREAWRKVVDRTLLGRLAN